MAIDLTSSYGTMITGKESTLDTANWTIKNFTIGLAMLATLPVWMTAVIVYGIFYVFIGLMCEIGKSVSDRSKDKHDS